MFDKVAKWTFLAFMPLYMISQYMFVRGVNMYLLLFHLPRLILFVLAMLLMLKKNNSTFITLMSFFFAYNVLSFVLYAFNGASVSFYIGTLQSYLFPMIFAWFGYRYSNDEKYNKIYLFSCLGCFLVGLYLYFTMPSYYLQFLYDFETTQYTGRDNVTENAILAYSRFSSFFGSSYMVSYLSIPALTISLSYTLNNNKEVNKFWCYFIAIVSFIAAQLCQQRIAMVYSVAVLLIYAFFSLKAKHSSKLLIVYAVVIVVFVSVLGAIGTLERFDVISDNMMGRLYSMDINSAMEQRTVQYRLSERATWWSYIFGLGMGSCGGVAREAGLIGVTDGEWVKLFYEMGLVGTSLFIMIILTSLARSLKYFRLYNIEFIVIVYFLAAGIGSNSLTMNIPCAMFWYCLGRIWNKKYYLTKISYS